MFVQTIGQLDTAMYIIRWAATAYSVLAELNEHCPQIITVKDSSDLELKLLDSLPLIWTLWYFQQEVLSYSPEVK